VRVCLLVEVGDDEREKEKRGGLTHPRSSSPDTAAQLPSEGLVRSSQHTCLLHLCHVHRLTLRCGCSSLAIL